VHAKSRRQPTRWRASLPITKQVLDATPARNRMFRSGEQPGALAFDGVLRRGGIRYDDLA
jgi:hypothetical protein